MKKWILTAALAAVTCFANAQDNINSKNGTPILPEAGDWSIGFDATPWLSYAGNLFNNTAGNSVKMGWQSSATNPMISNTIVGKYMVDATTAYRGMLRIGFVNQSSDSLVPNGAPGAAAGSTVANTYSNTMLNISLGAGMQKYRGKGRLKGYYGAEALLAFGSPSSTTITYGNSPANGGFGTTEMSAGSTFGLGVRGFVGAEYFFAPKMSISAEYGWHIMFMSQGQGTIKSVDGAGATTTTNTGGNHTFGIDTDNWNAAIVLSMYF